MLPNENSKGCFSLHRFRRRDSLFFSPRGWAPRPPRRRGRVILFTLLDPQEIRHEETDDVVHGVVRPRLVVGDSEARSRKRGNLGDYAQTSTDCNWGCFHWEYVVFDDWPSGKRFALEAHEKYKRRDFEGRRYYRLYIEYRGPGSALEVMAVSPSSYTGWGCDLSIFGRTCNRIHKLTRADRGERRQLILMEMIYGDSREATHDFRFIEVGGNAKKFKEVVLGNHSEYHRIIYRGGRRPNLKVIKVYKNKQNVV